MTGLEAAGWGLFGGCAVEGLALIAEARRVGGWPWSAPGQLPASVLALAVAIRVGIGAGLAAAAFSSGQIASAFAAVAVGVAAGKIVESMLAQVPLTPAPETSPPLPEQPVDAAGPVDAADATTRRAPQADRGAPYREVVGTDDAH